MKVPDFDSQRKQTYDHLTTEAALRAIEVLRDCLAAQPLVRRNPLDEGWKSADDAEKSLRVLDAALRERCIESETDSNSLVETDTQSHNSPDASAMRPLEADFYRDPAGKLVYRWSDDRLVVVDEDAERSSDAALIEALEGARDAIAHMEVVESGSMRHGIALEAMERIGGALAAARIESGTDSDKLSENQDSGHRPDAGTGDKSDTFNEGLMRHTTKYGVVVRPDAEQE